jgi:tetratricopeptide (TPR) repeat protein
MDGPVLGSAALNRLSSTLGARPVSAPGISSERTEALLAGATRVLTGYVSRDPGAIRITATEEDLATGKSLRVVTAGGATPTAALNQLAHEFSPRAGPSLTSNPEALQAWSTALEADSSSKRDLLEQAVHLDPAFGPAWVALAAFDAGRPDPAAAEDAMERASHQKLDEMSRAELDLLAANLKQDRSSSLAALRRIATLTPADTILLRSLAEAEVTAGQFAAAVSAWQKVTATFPNEPAAWNSLGYARSYAGDYAGALAAFNQYTRLRPKEANPSDSIGDLNYSFGKFSEAAANYKEAHAKQPDFEQSGDLYKAAWARFRTGDKAGADSLFSQFRTARTKSSSDRIADLITGDWLYRTGRKTEAVAALRKLASEAQSAPVRGDAYAQLAIWDLIEGDRAQAARDAANIGPNTSSPPLFMARFAALPSASAAEWELRAQTAFPASAASLRRLALGYALLLDGKREAAIPVWEQMVRTNSATDFFARAVYARLQGRPVDRPLLPEPGNLNQFAGILDAL